MKFRYCRLECCLSPIKFKALSAEAEEEELIISFREHKTMNHLHFIVGTSWNTNYLPHQKYEKTKSDKVRMQD